MKGHLRANGLLLVFTVGICCVIYPAVMYALGQGLFPTAACGGLVDEKGNGTRDPAAARGSRLVGQPFTADEYFWPRPSAAGSGYNATASSGSNWGANNPKLRDRVAQQLGPMVAYKAGSRSAGPDAASPRTPQADIEAWYAAAPDRAATWAADAPVGLTNWVKTDYAAATDAAPEKYGLQGEYVRRWAKDHPEVVDEWKKANPDKADEPKPEDLAGPFFASFAKVHPGKWPGVVEVKGADGAAARRVEPVSSDAALRANFFDLWVSDPANKEKAADLEPVPADMVTASGSGLDPDITLRNALSVYQLDRVAKARGVSTDRVAAVVRAKSFTPLSGLVGEPLVNVLDLNLALDAEFGVKTK